ncbi:DUF937 domain-containing protein [Actinomadura sp. ATCC 31491]|uniref:DUF937 domain-containing protein n=1 Tax=Actinomadura luzonensis TaxID=2805427 RepID=A0ABT0G116_9ACTN|nr:DUF937 domain-containing protein [Actinomadura luzonensis]MCK2217813.1 DUF937 domain-containing protein [Actinomadura luzonensis]
MTLHDERVDQQLLDQLGEPGMEQTASMLGTDEDKARDVMRAVTGVIIGGLARNVQYPDGADALRGALEDHVDADPFDGDVASLTRDGHSILGHVLGGQGTEVAATGLARLFGLDTGAMMKLLPLVAPMVMYLLATRAAVRDLDADALADDLERERAAMPANRRELLDELLDHIFGPGPARPGVYGGLPGTSLPDW